jgi:tripartite-type tricarboxylate transporter receptor subunit TctC
MEIRMIYRIALWIFTIIAARAASAQSYPAKPIRIIAPFTAGGPVDITARILAQKLSEAWGQQVIRRESGAKIN